MFARMIEKELLSLAASYPVITVIGPRQSGKTTLVQKIFPHKPYINLEAPDTRELALLDPRSFFEQCPDGAILNEIQRAPILLSYIQTIVDKRDDKGLFILTGSHQVELHHAITQSLAGRTALLHLLPMSLVELEAAEIKLSLDEALLFGGYPRIFKDHLDPTKAYRNYYQTYVERDLRQLINVQDLMQFQRFVKLCVGRIGQVLNMQSLGNDVGVSSHTIKHWISILEASFIIIRLQPYYENFGKRVIKAPKLYFTDVGLASYLLGIQDVEQMARDPLRGQLVENLMLLELLKKRYNEGLEPQLYFFRDTNGREVDFIFKKGSNLIPIEVKATKTFQSDFIKNLIFFKDLVDVRCDGGYIIYGGDIEQNIASFRLLPFYKASKAIP